ncbi:hypothetical protein [Peribacillus sp. TH27]|uniref:hypothetical protein n=1 Tax=Peribacillus sp. TH27 TaxID=2798484 RepID=UPI0019126192|nr:hypothetical protein [Peribacillus sp. TH27]MBK5458938.1 hypothetical protein [Peribacillus sp. TH27]
MSKLKRLATKEDNIVVIESPITSTVLSEREKDYPLLFPSDFAKKYRDLLFQPVKFHFKGQPFHHGAVAVRAMKHPLQS